MNDVGIGEKTIDIEVLFARVGGVCCVGGKWDGDVRMFD